MWEKGNVVKEMLNIKYCTITQLLANIISFFRIPLSIKKNCIKILNHWPYRHTDNGKRLCFISWSDKASKLTKIHEKSRKFDLRSVSTGSMKKEGK